MHLTKYLFLACMLQSVNTAQMISSQQKEGIGNLIALGLLALFVVALIVAGIRFKGRQQNVEEPETAQREAREKPPQRTLTP